jgi:hypothetical protein
MERIILNNRLLCWWRTKLEVRAEAKKILVKQADEKAVKAKYYAAAKLFNDLHCHTGDDLWMCPECNKVHCQDVEQTKIWCWLTGVHYPKCCRFGAGHRLFYELYATTGNQKKGQL